jgi:hypothetical protein
MSSPLRILHLSDLCVGAGPDLRDLFEDFAKADSQLFDYMAVCGNITADGKPAQFEVAKGWLSELGEKLLRPSDTRLRMLLVPGSRDVETNSAEPDYTAFGHFHDTFFAQAIDQRRVEKFNRDFPMVRVLKDLTLVAVCYWRPKRPTLEGPLFEQLIKTIDSAKEQVLSRALDYAKATPTIIASGGTPFSSREARRHSSFARLQAKLREDLSGTLHLFGSDNVTCIPFEPFVHHPPGFGTGPRNEGDFWPFRLNVITLDGCGFRSNKGPFISIASHERASAREQWQCHDPLIQGHLDRFVADAGCQCENAGIHAELFQKIEKMIFAEKRRFILVRGYPGAGKHLFFESFATHFEKSSKQAAKVITFKWEQHSPSKDGWQEQLAGLQRQVVEAQKQIKKKKPKPELIVLIYDNAFAGLNVPNKTQQRVEFDNAMRGVLAGFCVVYIMTKADYKYDVQPPPPIIELPRPEDRSLVPLIKCYSSEVPVTNKNVVALAGSYLGFGRHLLEETHELFKQWEGTRTLSNDTPQRLVSDAVVGTEVCRDATWFVRTLEGDNHGQAACGFFRRLVREQSASALAGRVIVFDEKDFLSAMGNPARADEANRLLKRLCKFHILHELSIGSYALDLLAPFLVAEKLDRFEVFISFAKEFQKQAELLANGLRKLAEENGRELTLYVFTEHANEPGDIPSEIKDKLSTSENFIVHFNGEVWGSWWVGSEANEWLTKWGQALERREACLVPINMGESGKWPDDIRLKRFRCIDGHGDLGEYLPKVFAQLAAKRFLNASSK